MDGDPLDLEDYDMEEDASDLEEASDQSESDGDSHGASNCPTPAVAVV